jgi:hypothetical protein
MNIAVLTEILQRILSKQSIIARPCRQRCYCHTDVTVLYIKLPGDCRKNKCDFSVSSNVMMLLPRFVKMVQMFQKLKCGVYKLTPSSCDSNSTFKQAAQISRNLVRISCNLWTNTVAIYLSTTYNQ